MRLKKQNALPVEKVKGKGTILTVRETDGILVLDIYKDGQYHGRYLLNLETGEHGILKEGRYWKQQLSPHCGAAHRWNWEEDIKFRSKADIELAMDRLKLVHGYQKKNPIKSVLREIGQREYHYGQTIRWNTQQNHIRRVQELMDTVPEAPEEFYKWAVEKVNEGMPVMYRRKVKEGSYWCPQCRKHFEKSELEKAAGGPIHHKDLVSCPKCGSRIQVKIYGKRTQYKGKAMLLQETTEGHCVVREFDVRVTYSIDGVIPYFSEAARIFAPKGEWSKKKAAAGLYMNQYRINDGEAWFDERNPGQRHLGTCFLFPEGIEKSLEKSVFRDWAGVFSFMAKKGIAANYAGLLSAKKSENLVGLMEYLSKGRFYRLAEEESDRIDGIGNYYGRLNRDGKTAAEVFGIQDQQKINRLRDRNGGERMLDWLRWSDRTGKKVSDRVLDFSFSEKVGIQYMKFILDRMSPEQAVNYVIRQQKTQYEKQTAGRVLNQWQDYLAMCKRLGKDVSDEMIYRPRELKRRHAEAVEAIRKLDDAERFKRDQKAREDRAKQLREKFPGAEETLQEIAARYEYADETYKIIVPRRLIEILEEGSYLHHCVGSSDRYFDRIKDQETYICFLRRQQEPETPYYTIEVEPGGTIRQHRGYLDEEPGIEEIRGFLRKWQQELRKRLKKADWELAGISAKKREQNLEELRRANNKRVLDGLMEDFMEAVG